MDKTSLVALNEVCYRGERRGRGRSCLRLACDVGRGTLGLGIDRIVHKPVLDMPSFLTLSQLSKGRLIR
jgi:hypothetical protein